MENSYLVLLTLLLSAFFSSSETAYFNLRKHRGNFSNKVENIINDPEKLLVTILTGNTFVNIALGSLAAVFTHEYFPNNSLMILLEVLIISTIILIFGEILPKIIALHNSEKFAELFKIPVKILLFLFTPFVYISSVVVKISSLLPINKEKIFDSEEELKILIWNILRGASNRAPEVISALLRHNADVAFLSEYKNNSDGDVIFAALGEAGYPYAYSPKRTDS